MKWLGTSAMFLFSVSAAVSIAAEPLVVITYNIHHGRGMDGVVDLDRIVAVIRAFDPHVVCLQEVDRNLPRTEHLDFPKRFAEKLGMTVLFEPNYQFDGGDYGNATLTRLPVKAYRNIALPNPINAEPRGCLAATIECQGQLIDVFNTHLGLNGQERLAQAEAIIEAFGEHPVILAGDMNELAAAPGMQRFLEHLKDTIEKQTDDTRGTVPVGAPMRRIDYILVDERFETLSATILFNEETQVASDHLPYVATIRLRVPETAVPEAE